MTPGSHHQLDRVDEPSAIALIRSAIESRPVVIADGHHRYEIARIHRREHVASRSAMI